MIADGQYVAQLFKWIKQHLRIKHFLGTSENAVKTQIWCAVTTYVLIAIVKKEPQLDASLYTCLQILSVSIFEKAQLACALQLDGMQADMASSANQLSLFEIYPDSSEIKARVKSRLASPMATLCSRYTNASAGPPPRAEKLCSLQAEQDQKGIVGKRMDSR